MKTQDIRSQKNEDLQNLLLKLKEDHFRMRFQRAIGQLENHRQLRLVKRDIARVLTEIKERARKASAETVQAQD